MIAAKDQFQPSRNENFTRDELLIDTPKDTKQASHLFAIYRLPSQKLLGYYNMHLNV